MKKQLVILSLLIGICLFSYGQSFSLGWSGNEIISKSLFTNTLKWNTGNSSGENCYVTTDSINVYLHWKFGAGNRAKWAICFQILDQPFALSDSDIVGIDIKGSECNPARNVRIKFEDGTQQVSHIWHGLASLNRWCDRLVVLKKQFEGSMNWNQVKIITFEVSSDASSADTQSDSGTVVFRKLQMDNAANWHRTNTFESLKDTSYLDTIKQQALQGILARQTSTGLFYTWREDKSSWLYGHGILLKVLTIEGIWQNSSPLNASAIAAEKLALFLANHQDTRGFWPRAWNSDNGTIRVNLESDGSIWMGDFPWIITGLVNYYSKTGDSRVLPAIQKARSFLYNLIDVNGKFYTMNMNTNVKYEVTSAEAYTAAIISVYELGDSLKAINMIDYISSKTWDTDLKYWKESIYSNRPVLFANTWMAQLMYLTHDYQKAYDALSFIGKAMNTKGPGKPEGMDGIGPVATWYEGTLTYICSNAPESQMLFDSIIKYRFDDGTIPAYNDNIGGKVDIWAVNWSSLDATLWLYFAATKSSPFNIYYKAPDIPIGLNLTSISPVLIFPNPARDKFSISPGNNGEQINNISIYDLMGRIVIQINDPREENLIDIDLCKSKSGIYIIKIAIDDQIFTEKIEIIN